MDVSYRWLKDIAPGLSMSPQELAERLAGLGSPVEELEDLAEELGDVVVARVVTAGRHPDADRLSLCEVEGAEGIVQVICGAPNVQAGGWYPFAPVGATLPGGFTLKRAKIRGEYSNGMLCSPKELGLGEDHEGILELHGDFRAGESFVDAVGLRDWRMDVEVTSNRGDLLSHVGIAREAAAGLGVELVSPDIPGGVEPALTYTRGEAEASAGGARVVVEDGDLCWRYLGAVIKGVKVGPSPDWLANRLRAAGSRSINNVVDATNFVLLELGQPLHAFDLDLLEDRTVVVRTAREGESLTTLDGVDRSLSQDMLMICDAVRPVALAGVMGGENSEVSAETTDVLLECALFHPGRTRQTRRDLGMSTDASYRFERGVDPEGMEQALERCVEIILATAGGVVEGTAMDVCPRPYERREVKLRPARVEHVLGVRFTSERIRELLAPLGFEVEAGADDSLRVAVPGFRSYDVTREIDLIEEIARMHGYDEFPADLGHFRPGTVEDDALFQLQDRIRDMLVARGMLEAQTPAFARPAEGEVEVLNPVSSEESHLRSSLMPALLRRVEYNFARGARHVRLFETGTVFAAPAGPGEAPREETHVAVALTGGRVPSHWSGPAPSLDIWDVKGVMEDVLAVCGWAGAVEPATDPRAPLEAGMSFIVCGPDGAPVGWGGRVSPDRIDSPAWADDVWAIELTLPDPPPAGPEVIARAAPPFPGIDRDLAAVLPAGVSSVDAEAVIRRSAGKHFVGLEVFDVYTGSGIPAGARSVAFRLLFRSMERTLTDKDVDRAAKKVVQRLKEELGVEVRGR
jgi:phenylalanyl-tRNA synthetase beta chain